MKVEPANLQQQSQWLLDSLGDGIFDWNIITGKVAYSPSLKTTLGYNADENWADFEAWRSLVHPEDLETAMGAVKQHLAGHTSIYEAEYRMRAKNGSYQWILARGKVEFNSQGQPVRMIGIHQDITERKRAETALQQSDRLLKAIFDQTIAQMWILTPQGKILQANQTALNFLDTTAEAVKGMDFGSAWWQNSNQTQQSLKEAIGAANEGKTVNYKLEVSNQSGSLIVDFFLKPITDEQNHVVLLIAEARDITAAEQAQAAIRASEQRYRLLAEHSTDLISTQTAEGILTYVSPACKNLLGYEPELLVGSSIYDLYHPEERRKQTTSLNDDQASAQPIPNCFTHSYRIRRHDGSYIWLETTNHLLYDQGQIDKIISVSRDITARKAAEAEVIQLNQELEARVQRRTAQLESAIEVRQQLLEREHQAKVEIEQTKKEIELYGDVVKNIQIGLCVWQLEDEQVLSSFRLVAANPAANKILGIALEDKIGCPITECFPSILEPQNYQRLETYASVIFTGEAQQLSEVYYNDNETSGVYTVKIFALPHCCVGLAFEDITERKQIEQALIESTQRYRSVVNSVQEVIFQTDAVGCWKFLNPAWTAITGFSVIESLNHSVIDYVFAPEDKNYIQKQFDLLMREEKTSFTYEFRLFTKQSDFRWLEINAQLDKDADGAVLGTIGTIKNVTERKKTEAVLQSRAEELARLNAVLLGTTAQLEKRNQELDQFAYVASHDLKAPLRAIANLSHWLEEDLEGKLDEDTAYQMHLLRSRVHRMENLINGLLQYSRAGRFNYRLELVDVNELLDELIDSLDIPPQFEIEIEPMPTLRTWRIPLEQVFINLISNGIKHHNRDSGRITITVSDRDQFYQFAVEDDGPGIAPEYYDKIFVIFQTLVARDKNENTGIGLSIIKKTVEHQGGEVWLESKPGKGTTFYFTWPKQPAESS